MYWYFSIDNEKEKCGDGRNMRILQCDDGNNRDGDGCSKDCQIEKDWECFGGGENKPDVCNYIAKPRIKNIQYFDNLTIKVTFTNFLRITRIFLFWLIM